MTRLVLIPIAVLFAASPALADAGTPGSTFPEQPGTTVAHACVAIATNPGTGVTGQAGASMSSTANTITSGLLTDACFGQ